MRVPGLPLVAKLCNGLLFALGNEDGIEPEALAALSLERDAPLQHAGAANLTRSGRDGDQLTDVTRAATVACHAGQLAQQPAHLVAGRASRRAHARCAPEPFHLEPGVLAQHPAVASGHGSSELRLSACVLVVRLAFLGRELLGVERI